MYSDAAPNNEIERIPSKLRDEMFKDITSELRIHMPGRVYGSELAQGLNEILFRQFIKPRGNGLKHHLNPIFVGQYFVDPRNPEITRPLGGASIDHGQYEGTGACTELPIIRGIIGRAIRTGETVYVPDTTAPDLDHISCDSRSVQTPVSELVIVSWSQPYTRENPNWTQGLDGKRVPVGVFDLDFQGRDVLDERFRKKLERICRLYGSSMFKEMCWNLQPDFRPPNEMAVK